MASGRPISPARGVCALLCRPPPLLRALGRVGEIPLRLRLLSLSLSLSLSLLSHSDAEIREKKNACYADIERWCRSSTVSKENCALRCLSPTCYELVYGSDPLEEGEIDYIRGQEYKYCMHKLSIGESLDGVKGSFNY
ncbi:unnamed protein product [Spirodela intermedia]|uniref:Uncharacterized protein n=1 Tax=Spirodela intermedia TaxID=51605 RepID=A0A7I8JJC0_SPIIN|nr:unnamed protein product [Spirodela intermedia]CAA6669512.1 unnamed protein product [Spirodela intermedia]